MIKDLKTFQKAYSMLLGKAWTSSSNMAMTKADPLGAMKAAGFDLPTGASVNFHSIEGYESLEDQYNMYLAGLKTEQFSIALPPSPPSKGHIVNPTTMKADDTTVCCCCCPCCSCT